MQFVKFGIENQQKVEGAKEETKGLIWLLVALNYQDINDDIQEAFKCMFRDKRYMKLYDPARAYMIRDQKKLLQALEVLKRKNLQLIDFKFVD